MANPNELILVDGSSFLYRAYFAELHDQGRLPNRRYLCDHPYAAKSVRAV